MIWIREAESRDFGRVEEILIQNNQLPCPEIDGKKAMAKVKEKMGRYFLVADYHDYIIGMIRGVYDGSRALMHLISVDQSYQQQGTGKKLIYELASRFKEDGAPSISVTSSQEAKSYYDLLGFEEIPVTLMVGYDIDVVLEKINSNTGL